MRGGCTLAAVVIALLMPAASGADGREWDGTCADSARLLGDTLVVSATPRCLGLFYDTSLALRAAQQRCGGQETAYYFLGAGLVLWGNCEGTFWVVL